MSDAAFCDTEEALFECPTTCGKCDQLLESVVLSVLGITTPGIGGGGGKIYDEKRERGEREKERGRGERERGERERGGGARARERKREG